jgi:hypothetical protein
LKRRRKMMNDPVLKKWIESAVEGIEDVDLTKDAAVWELYQRARRLRIAARTLNLLLLKEVSNG